MMTRYANTPSLPCTGFQNGRSQGRASCVTASSMISPAFFLVECVSARCVVPVRQHNDTIFLVESSQVSSKFDTKEQRVRGGLIMPFAESAVGLRTTQR